MDQEVAVRIFEEGAFLIFMDVPIGTEFGIDMNSWNTGEKFRGVKMIPPGLHYVYYSAVSKEGQSAPRTGFFHYFKQREVVARRWKPSEEDVVDADEEETERFRQNLKNMDPFLGAYPLESWKKWVSLSNRITEPVLEKLEPLQKKICSVADLIPGEKPQTITGRIREKDKEEHMLPSMQARPGTELRFTPFPANPFPEGASAAEKTHFSLDSSYTLQQLLSHWERPQELLGEIQLAFLCFLIGHSYSAFEQWKKLVRVICTADEALTKYPQLFMDFISDLYFQMQEVPADFFIDIISQGNFLTETLRIFFANIAECSETSTELKKRATKLQNYLTERFQWDFDLNPDEDAPVVVELPDS